MHCEVVGDEVEVEVAVVEQEEEEVVVVEEEAMEANSKAIVVKGVPIGKCPS
jgi:hypothetical protein